MLWWEFRIMQSLCYHFRAWADQASCNWSPVTPSLALLALPQERWRSRAGLGTAAQGWPNFPDCLSWGFIPPRKTVNIILRWFSWLSLSCNEQQPRPEPRPAPPWAEQGSEIQTAADPSLARALICCGPNENSLSEPPARPSSGCCLSLCVVAENHLE